MNGLKLEPGWRQACVTRLNLLRLKSKPPTSARIEPSARFAATSAACTSGSCAISHSPCRLGDAHHRAAARCAARAAPGRQRGATNFRPSPLISIGSAVCTTTRTLPWRDFQHDRRQNFVDVVRLGDRVLDALLARAGSRGSSMKPSGPR